MNSHALLSASSSHRWLECPPSARLCANEPDTTSEYAAEGTLAHAYAENRLKGMFSLISHDEYKKERERIEKDKLYSLELKEEATKYVEEVAWTCSELAAKTKSVPYLTIEERVDFSEYVPEGFGTVDALIYSDKTKTLYIYDLKYGKGVEVSAVKNPQLLLYALGGIKAVSLVGDVQNVVVNIVQPRLDNFSSYEISPAELKEFAKMVKEKAELAIKGAGDFNPSEENCRFCKVKAKCRARADKLVSLYFEDPMKEDKALLKDDELADYFKRGKELTGWYNDLEAELFGRMMKGKKIKGFKLAKGRKTRSFTDCEKAIDTLVSNGFEKPLFYETKPLALTKIEKIVGANNFKLVDEFVTYKEGNPRIVFEDAKDEEYIPLEEAFGN